MDLLQSAGDYLISGGGSQPGQPGAMSLAIDSQIFAIPFFIELLMRLATLMQRITAIMYSTIACPLLR